MAIWKCNRCEKEFYDGGQAPLCPACRAGRSMLTALENQAVAGMSQEEFSGRVQYVESGVLSYLQEIAGESGYLSGTIAGIRARGAQDADRIRTQGAGRVKAERDQEKNAFDSGKYTLSRDLENEKNQAIQKIHQQAEAPKKESGLKFLNAVFRKLPESKILKAFRKKENFVVAVVLYVLFVALLLIYNAYTSTLPYVDPEIDFRGAGRVILFLLFYIPIYVLACLTIFVAYRGFVRWFYRFTARKAKIEKNKTASVGKTVSDVQQYYEEQINYLYNVSLTNPPPEQSLDSIRSFYETIVRQNRQTNEEIQRIQSETKDAVEKRNRDMEQEVRAAGEKWLSDVSEAAANYVRLFERQFYSSSMDRGPAYWLLFRFCGDDGAIAAAPRGVGHLRTVIDVSVELTETHFCVDVRDPQGKQLIRDEGLRYYRFADVNERNLSQPAERMGYAAALLACTLYEANDELGRAKYDRSFDLGIVTNATEKGFSFEYEGLINA